MTITIQVDGASETHVFTAVAVPNHPGALSRAVIRPSRPLGLPRPTKPPRTDQPQGRGGE